MRKKFDETLYRALKEENFVVLDIETTGFHPEKHSKIIEIGALKIKGGKFVEQFQALINPEVPITAKITEVTGITNEMVVNEHVYEDVLPHLYAFIEDCVIVCHNTPFDWDRFLLYYFKILGYYPTNQTLDTMKLFKKVYPKTSEKNLKVMSETMGVELQGHHRAVNDALVTAKCFLKLRKVILEEFETQFSKQIQLLPPKEKTPLPIIYPTYQTVVVSANYWEKPISKKVTHRRIYVSLREGEIFGKLHFDCNRRRWYNDDFPYDLDFSRVELLVMKKMNVAKLEEVLTLSKVS